MHDLGAITAPNFDSFFDAIEPPDSEVEQRLVDIAKDLEAQLGLFDKVPSTTQRIAWLHLFTRNMNVVRTALALGALVAPQMGEVLRRLQFELLLDFMLIQGQSAALRVSGENPGKAHTPESVRSRLSAYVTYCIHQDLVYYRQIRQGEHLDEMYKPKIAGEVSSNPSLVRLLEQLWGSGTKAQTAAETREERKKVQRNAHQMVNRLRDLIDSDSDVSSWYDVLNQRYRERKYTFAELVDPELTSISHLTRHMLGRVSAMDYQWTSAAIHGKSIENIVFYSKLGAAPYTMFADVGMKEDCLEDIARLAHMNSVHLRVLSNDVFH